MSFDNNTIDGSEGYNFEPLKADYPDLVQNNSNSSESSDSDTDNTVNTQADWREGRKNMAASVWCKCGKCVSQKTDPECFCCKEHELLCEGIGCLECYTDKDDLEQYIVYRPSLEMAFVDAMIQRHVKGPMPDELSNRQYRLMAYRMFIKYIHWGQILGKHVRRPIPSCCVEYIHKRFPAPDGQYTGFKEYSKDLDKK